MATNKNTSTIGARMTKGGAASMSAIHDDAAKIAGARKCLDLLRALEQAVNADNAEDSPQAAAEYYAQRLSNVQALVSRLGPMTPEQAGAFGVLVEYAQTVMEGYEPAMGNGAWLPLSAMSEREIHAKTARLVAEREAVSGRQRQVPRKKAAGELAAA